MDLDDEYVGSSYHFNDGRRIMSREEEENVDWENINGSEIPIVKDFVKLCLVEDDIWGKIKGIFQNLLRTTILVGVDVALLAMWLNGEFSLFVRR